MFLATLSTSSTTTGDPALPMPVLIVGAALCAIWIFAVIDAARRPDWVWNACGKSKVLWVVLIAALGGAIGGIIGFVYLVSQRPKLREVAATTEPPPPTWTGPFGVPPYGAPAYGSTPFPGPPAGHSPTTPTPTPM